MQLSPSASSANQSKVQPRYSGGIGVSGNQPQTDTIPVITTAGQMKQTAHLIIAIRKTIHTHSVKDIMLDGMPRLPRPITITHH
ncbi:MAG: hypothetical protein WCC17_25265 [Candidatus Nitrosopolaris sp.]